MDTFTIDDAPLETLAGYVDEAFWRFLHTWGCVRDIQGTALELGDEPVLPDLSAPRVHRSGPDARELLRVGAWHPRAGGALAGSRRFGAIGEVALRPLQHGRGSLPVPDNSFSVVFFCEIIEHLLMNPLHSLNEIHRVLAPDGTLVITTPNVARLENVLALVAGTNIYDPYSGHGPYGRHNREYTLHDLAGVLEFAGFTIERAFTADSACTVATLRIAAGLRRGRTRAGVPSERPRADLFAVARPTASRVPDSRTSCTGPIPPIRSFPDTACAGAETHALTGHFQDATEPRTGHNASPSHCRGRRGAPPVARRARRRRAIRPIPAGSTRRATS